MNKATEELRKQIADIKLSFGIGGCKIGEHYANQILKLLKDMGYKREVEKKLPIRFLHPNDKPNISYETAKQDMLNWHNASLEEIGIE